MLKLTIELNCTCVKTLIFLEARRHSVVQPNKLQDSCVALCDSVFIAVTEPSKYSQSLP